MASLSEKLRRERELRGISLRQISEDTKIGVRFLEALEEDAVDRIPGEFYRRSYLRAYARYLGLDEDRAVNAYNYSKSEASEAADSSTNESENNTAWLRWGLAAAVVVLPILFFLKPPPSNETTPSTEGQARPATGLGSAKVARATKDTDASSDANSNSNSNAIARTSPSPEDNRGASSSGDAFPTFPTAGSRPNDGADSPPEMNDVQTAASTNGLDFVLTIDEACWLEVMADGEVVVSGLKEVGFSSRFTARDEVRLWLGNAGGVRLSVNGQSLRPLGESGQVRKDLMITKSNYTEYVASASDAP